MNDSLMTGSGQRGSDLSTTAVFDYTGWRQVFLRTILIGACVFGLIALIPAFLSNSAPIFLEIYGAAYLVLLLVTFVNFPYTVKAGLFLLLIYAIGFSGILENGIWGDSRVYFLALITVSALLFSPRAGIIATVISLLSLIVGGYLIVTKTYQISSSEVNAGDANIWITGTTSVLLLAVVILSGIALLQRGFNRARNLTNQALNELKAEQLRLKQRVEERTDELLHRSEQLHSATVIARQISAIQDVPALLTKVVDLVSTNFGYDHVGIYLTDEERRSATLQAASSEIGKQQIARGHRVEPGQASPIWQTIESGRYQLISGAEHGQALNRDAEYPPSRSELTIPLTVRGRVIGVMDIHLERSEGFRPGDLETLETLGDQIAASIDNTRLLNETKSVLTQLEALAAQRTRNEWQDYTKRRIRAFQYTPAGIRTLTEEAASKAKGGLQIPLQLRGQEIGTISLEKKAEAQWTQAEQDFVEKISTQISLALDNSRLLEETRQRASQEQTVSEISARLNRSLDLDSLLQTAARELGSLPQVAEVSVFAGGSEENPSQGQGEMRSEEK